MCCGHDSFLLMKLPEAQEFMVVSGILVVALTKMAVLRLQNISRLILRSLLGLASRPSSGYIDFPNWTLNVGVITVLNFDT